MVVVPLGAWVSATVLDATGDRDAARRHGRVRPARLRSGRRDRAVRLGEHHGRRTAGGARARRLSTTSPSGSTPAAGSPAGPDATASGSRCPGPGSPCSPPAAGSAATWPTRRASASTRPPSRATPTTGSTPWVTTRCATASWRTPRSPACRSCSPAGTARSWPWPTAAPTAAHRCTRARSATAAWCARGTRSAFDLDTGERASGPAVRPQPMLQTRVQNGRVHVRRDEERTLRTNPVGR